MPAGDAVTRTDRPGPGARNVRSVAVECARVLERMRVPFSDSVPVTVGEHERGVSRAVADMSMKAVAVSVARPIPPEVGRAMAVREPAMVAVAGRMNHAGRVGVRDGQERQNRPEREPGGRIAAMVSTVVPAARVRRRGGGEHGRKKRNRRQPHRTALAAQPTGRRPTFAHRVHRGSSRLRPLIVTFRVRESREDGDNWRSQGGEKA